MKLYPDATNRFLDEGGSARTSSSRQSKHDTYRLLQSRHPDLELDQFTTEHLTRFCLADGLAPATSAARRSRLIALFDWCHYAKLIKANPASDLKFTVKTSRTPVRTHHWMSEDAVTELLRTGDGFVADRNRIVLLIGLFLGMRRVEIAGLRWSNFAPDLSTVRFIGKGQKIATLGVPVQLRTALQAWRLRLPNGTDVIFPSINPNITEPMWNRSIGVQGIYYIVRDAGRRVGIEGLAPHDMRRTFAGLLEEKGVKIQDISRLMRHSNVGTTSVYLETNPNKTTALADVIEFKFGT